MPKIAISVLIGVLALGWLAVVYGVAFDYLYLNIAIKEKMEYCGQFFDQYGSCKGVAYIMLWLMETPLLITTFLSLALTLYVARKHLAVVDFNDRYIVTSYLIGYLVWTNTGEFGDAVPLVSWYNVGVVVYHGGVFMGCLWVASHLTKSSSRPPSAAA